MTGQVVNSWKWAYQQALLYSVIRGIHKMFLKYWRADIKMSPPQKLREISRPNHILSWTHTQRQRQPCFWRYLLSVYPECDNKEVYIRKHLHETTVIRSFLNTLFHPCILFILHHRNYKFTNKTDKKKKNVNRFYYAIIIFCSTKRHSH